MSGNFLDYSANDPFHLDLQGTAEDFLLAGVDTTSITTAMLLYHVARNPEVQTNILSEINSVIPPTEDPSVDVINSASQGNGLVHLVFVTDLSSFTGKIPYTRATLKESLRLNPVSIGFGRYLVKDMEISGYSVPKKVSRGYKNLGLVIIKSFPNRQ